MLLRCVFPYASFSLFVTNEVILLACFVNLILLVLLIFYFILFYFIDMHNIFKTPFLKPSMCQVELFMNTILGIKCQYKM